MDEVYWFVNVGPLSRDEAFAWVESLNAQYQESPDVTLEDHHEVYVRSMPANVVLDLVDVITAGLDALDAPNDAPARGVLSDMEFWLELEGIDDEKDPQY